MDAGDSVICIEGAQEHLAEDDAAGSGKGNGQVFDEGGWGMGRHEEIVRGWRMLGSQREAS